MKHNHYSNVLLAAACICFFAACSDDPVNPDEQQNGAEAKYVGKAVGNFSAENWELLITPRRIATKTIRPPLTSRVLAISSIVVT